MEQNLNVHIGPRAVKFFIDKRVNSSLEEYGITASDGPFILCIEENEGISLKDITTVLSVDKALSTRVVKTLIDDGFAENISDDARRYSMRLTDKGKDIAKIIRVKLDECWSILLKDLTPEEKECFSSAIEKIRNVIRQESGGNSQ